MQKIKEFFYKKRKADFKILAVILVFSVIFGSLTFLDNISIEVEEITLKNLKIPKTFNGYKIAHISDFHNRENKVFLEKIVITLKENNPDIIFLTGDMVDELRTNTKVALSLIKKLTEIAPVYYVFGNHESDVEKHYPVLFIDYINKLENMGVVIMNNNKISVSNPKGDKINIYGLDELYSYTGDYSLLPSVADSFLSEFEINNNEYNVLLAHHPEQIDTYTKYGFDLVFSGHAHGGQIIIFGKGIIAPNQGLFPEYTSGMYLKDDTRLIVSRGLGNSRFPFRIFNKPHIIIAELKSI